MAGGEGGGKNGASPEIRRMDSVLNTILESLSELCTSSIQMSHDMMSAMLNVFDQSILRAIGLHTPPFVLLYLSSLCDIYPTTVIRYLAARLLSPTEHTVVKRSAALYLGGYLARAALHST
eukprot:GABW01000037.1.p1 GENE.GABW01000037.1~~GABW01000037.1.p1  ORF type:complete len:121 (-),score=13.40 GABW01000037.1:3-365(-)